MAKEASYKNKTSFEQAFLTVALGASAGGVKALKEFFGAMPSDSGMAFIVILHLSRIHKSNLAEILQRTTKMKVTQVERAVKIVPNHVYVIPPAKHLEMVDDRIKLKEPAYTKGARVPVDRFFRTLADAYESKAVCVILSGTGSDGTLGMRHIKGKGGFAIIQDPQEAEYDGMPRSAIQTKIADVILPVAAMPEKLLFIRDTTKKWHLAEADGRPIAAKIKNLNLLSEILTLLRVRTGHDFSNYKRSTVIRRLLRQLQVYETDNLREYQDVLRTKPEEAISLMKSLLINVTNFFRDREAFDLLEKKIIPALFKGKTANDQVRVWVAGCSTGEEAYSIAILLSEYASTLARPPRIKVFASDVDDDALAEARNGRFTASIATDVSPQRLREFFIKEKDHGFRVHKKIREMILFAPHNILHDPPFSRLDLISCRNVMIYLNRETQEQVLQIFHFALRESGYLFLGISETVDSAPGHFTPVDKKRRIYKYRRSGITRDATPASLPIAGVSALEMQNSSSKTKRNMRTFGELHHRLIEYYAPPSILINDGGTILHLSENAGRFLRFAGGEPSANIMRVIHPALLSDLRAALFTAGKENKTVEVRNIRVQFDGNESLVNMTIRPVAASEVNALILFEETTNALPPEESMQATIAGDKAMETVVYRLETELKETKDKLRYTIEQYETSSEELKSSNEELQAINGELRSATEKLEASKEELQSVNEELTTVNHKLKDKIAEVSHSNSDLENLVRSTDIATILLDRELKIKRYTPRTTAIFNLIPGDIGRPLSHITHQLSPDNFAQDAARVLQSLQSSEREVCSGEGRIFIAHFSPYQTTEDKIDGVVITFFDISESKQDQLLTREQAHLLEMIASGNILDTVLHEICKTLPKLNKHARAGILLANEDRSAIERTITEEIPPSFGTAIKGTPINDQFIGTCGRAIFERTPVTCVDIQQEKKWSKKWRDLCEAHQIRACHSTPVVDEKGLPCASFLLCFDSPHKPTKWELRLGRFGAHIASLAIQRHHTESRLKEGEARQHFLLKLSDTLRPLTNSAAIQSAATRLLGRHLRTSRALYLQITPDGAYGINKQGYAAAVPGFTDKLKMVDFGKSLVKVLEENETVVIADVEEDSRLTKKERDKYLSYSIRASVAVPLMREGRLQAVFNVHQSKPRLWRDYEIKLLQAVAERIRTAIDLVGVQEALRESENQLAIELADMRQLQYLSTQLIRENDMEILFRQLLDAAMGIMKSDAGSLQMFYPERNELNLLTSKGLDPESAKFWEWVKVGSNSTCGMALDMKTRIIVPDVEANDCIADSEDLAFYRLSGIRAVQSTPLISRVGKLVGMISTHWYKVHQVSERDLHLLDVVARQATDIIERTRSEEALRQSEENYRVIVNQAVAGILKIDMSGHIIFANTQFGKMLGYSTEELLRMKMIDLVHEKDRTRHIRMFELMKKEGREYRIEKRLMRKDGSYIWVNNYNAAIFAKDGQPRYAAIISINISDQKAIEKKKDEFISIASHELKTPLTSIKAYAEMLEEIAAENKKEDFASLTKKLNKQIDRMNRLIYSLLNTNRITEGRFTLNRETFDLNRLIAEQVEEIQLTAPHHKLTVEASTTGSINADRDRIGQVLANLIANAIKYSPDANEVIISTVSLNKEVRINVRDFGIGLSPEAQKKIFKRFYQAGPQSNPSGFGLGLYISREIIKMHGGMIGVEPPSATGNKERSNKGSVFYFTLPYESINNRSA